MKQKTGRKLLSFLLTLAMLVGLMPGMSLTAFADETYTLYVGGEQVTGETPSGTGWSYDADTKTLTLNGYSYSGEAHSSAPKSAAIYAGQDLTIELTGTNSVTNNKENSSAYDYAVFVNGSLSIRGSGTLTAQGGTGISAERDLTLKGGTITATGTAVEGCSGHGIHVKTMTVESGEVTATATNTDGSGISCEDRDGAASNLTILGGKVTASGSGMLGHGISVQGGNVTITDGEVTARATGSGGIGIYCKSSSGGGSVAISGGAVTATATGENGSGVNSTSGVTVEDGTLTADGMKYGIYSGGEVTISGGTVAATATGEEGCGIRSKDYYNGEGYTGNVTISDGTVTASGKKQGIFGNVTLDQGMAAKAGENENSSSPVTGTDTLNTYKWVKAEAASESLPLLYVGGVQVTDSVLSGEGWSFDKATHTLTLEGYTSNGDGYTFETNESMSTSKAAVYYGGPGALTILLKGENSITCNNSTDYGNRACAIKSTKDVVIRAENGGKLILNASGYQAIDVDARNLTLASGEINCCFTKATYGTCLYTYNGTLTVNGGKLTLSGSSGIESRHVRLNGGKLSIDAEDAGVVCRGKYHEDNYHENARVVDEYGSFLVKGGSATITALTAVSMQNANFTVKGGSAELNGSGAAVEIRENGKMTLGENVTMKYGENKDGVSAYEGEKDKAYDALRKIEQDYVVIREAAKYVSLAYVEPHTHTIGEGDNAKTITFQPWTSTDSLPTESGSYYLTQNVTLSETWTVRGTNNLCLNGHSIDGPTNESYVFNVGTNKTLNLYDCGVTAGTIIARYKNGVTVAPGSTFNLYGGKITSNTDNQAIGVENYGTFNMYGGEISGNKGTGVSNVDGTFTMTGGTIRDNGKGVANQDIFKLSGNPTITNNKSGTDDSAKDNNVSLADNKVITIDGVLSNTTPIGVTMSAPGVFTSGWNDKMSDKTPTDYFTSDDSAYTVQVDGNELKLAVIKTNPTVTAPTAKSLTYTGSAQELVNAGSATGGTMYYAFGDANGATQPYTTSIPAKTDAGTYYVWYKVVGDENHNDAAPACVTATIAAPVYYDAPTPSTPAAETVTIPVSGENETVNVKVEVKDDTATVKETDIDKVLSAEEVGTVTVDVSALKENVNEVVIPNEMLEKVADAVADEENTADGLEVKLPAGSVAFDADALATITEQADGKDLTLHLDDVKVTELTSAQQEGVSDLEIEVVLDAYLTSGGKRISDFNGGSATVKIPYTLKEGQTAQGIVVWYVAADGTRTQVSASYDGKNVVFTVPHFSNYVIAYDAEKAAECPKDATCPISAFDDADPTAWYHDGVHFVLANGIMNGMGDGKFAPNDNTSRAMIVTILYRLEGEPVIRSGMPFSDVKESDWYAKAVSWAESKGIVNGFEDGTFRPNAPITREQLAAILYRYAQTKGEGFQGLWSFKLDFPDAADVSDWATEAMSWMVMQGVINGMDGRLNPQGDATRVQIAAMVHRFCELIK